MIVLEQEPEVRLSVVATERHWKLEALRAVYSLCQRRDTFTVDHLKAMLESRGVAPAKSSAALGAVLHDAVRRGWCTKMDEPARSNRKIARSRKVAQWKSKGLLLQSWDGLL